MRSKPLLNLLNSVKKQTLYPTEILVIDGSTNVETEQILRQNYFENLIYFKVDPEHRGLTKQRNFGINKVRPNSEIVCFLDDDTVLEHNYFDEIIKVFLLKTDAIGVGGVAKNENRWKLNSLNFKQSSKHYVFGNYYITESSRNYFRNIFGLNSDKLPGVMPEFGNGRTFGYPLNNQIYAVDLLIGMAMNFRNSLFDKIRFSTYFEGYGLYEDADFSLRALQYGQNYIATGAQLNHYHDRSGRPNQYSYGKMVVRNGWYVWRIKFSDPSFKARIKWHLIVILLTLIRFTNIVTTSERKKAFTETIGRTVGWFSLLFDKPKIQN